MIALFLTTTITCGQAIALLNKIQSNHNLPDSVKTDLIQTIRSTIPTCPVKINKNGK